MVKQVVSGGQTGIDTIGLDVAQAIGISTGGWAARGWKTENGPRPELGSKYGLKEAPSPGYNARTKLNVKDSDGTVIFGDVTSIGSYNTIEYCEKYGKPCIINPTPHNFFVWLKTNKIEVLNVAGNRGSKLSGVNATMATNTLTEVLSFQMVN